MTEEDQSDPTALTTQALVREISHLKELLMRVMDERDVRYTQRFEAQERAVEVALSRVDKEFHEHLISAREESKAALAATEKAIDKAEAAVQKAIDKDEHNTDKRFDVVNESIRKLENQLTAVTGG